jgi:hypothetical protein
MKNVLLKNNLKNGEKALKTEERILSKEEQAQKQIEKEIEDINKIKEIEQGIEDERQSSEYFSKLTLQDFLLAFFTLTCI